MIPDSKLQDLFPNNEDGPTFTRTLSDTRAQTAKDAWDKINNGADSWGIDMTQYDTDTVDITDLHLPALGPWCVLLNRNTGKAVPYDAFWTNRNVAVTLADMKSRLIGAGGYQKPATKQPAAPAQA